PAPPRQPGPTLGSPFARGVIAADVLVDIGVQPAARFSQALHLDHMLQARMPGVVAVGTAVVEADADPVRPALVGGDARLPVFVAIPLHGSCPAFRARSHDSTPGAMPLNLGSSARGATSSFCGFSRHLIAW